MSKRQAGLDIWHPILYKLCLGAVVFVLIPGMFLSTVAARQYDITLVVTVTDCSNSQPIQGATVTVLSAATAEGSVYQAITNARGRATLEPVRVGDVTHTVQVSAPSYKPTAKTQYMQAWSTVNMELCLEPETPPLIQTSTLTFTPEVLLTLEASPTADEAQNTRCGNHLAEQLKGLAAPENSGEITGGINDVTRCMLQCRAAASGSATQTGETVEPIQRSSSEGVNYTEFYACFKGCADFGYFQKAARVIITNKPPNSKIISTLANLMSSGEGTDACGDSGVFIFQLVKQLAIHGAQINLVAVHSPVNLWVSDREGRRAGTLEDGKVVEEIPDSRVVKVGESKYVILPVLPELKIDLKSTGKGKLSLELAYTKNDTLVQDVAYYDVDIEPETGGSVNLTPSQPMLELTPPDLGTQSVPPSRFEEIPVMPLPTRTEAAIASALPELTVTPAPTTRVEGWLTGDNQKYAILVASVCCLGLLLLGILLGGILWSRRRARRKAIKPASFSAKECPRCGASCQADARFCYKCGLSFIPTAPQAALPLPPPPAPIACIKCGQALRATSKFCPKCGQLTGR